MSHEAHQGRRSATTAKSQENGAHTAGRQDDGGQEREPQHGGKGHLVENIVVFVILFGMFLLGMYMLTWFTRDNMWPMLGIVVLSFLAFFIPQGILGRSDTGYNLAQGKQTDAKETSASVSS